MEYRELGSSLIRVSALGFGAWAIGGPGQWGWGRVDDDDSVAAIRKALDLGITLIDTADAYGAGHSEEVVGRAIKGRRENVVVATKFGVVVDSHGDEVGVNGSYDYVLRACDASLRRLGTDYIDLYQMHSPDDKTPLEETMRALSDLVQQGKVRVVGVSNFDVSQLEEASRHASLVSDQPPYSLLNRTIEAETLPWCLGHGLSVLAYAPMAHGILAGTYRPGMTFAEGDWRQRDEHFQGDKFARNLAVVEGLKRISARSGRSVAQLALAWVLHQSPSIVALVGTRRASQIEETAAAATWKLSDAENKEIDTECADAVPVLI